MFQFPVIFLVVKTLTHLAQKDIRGALLYHILFSNKASFGTVVKSHNNIDNMYYIIDSTINANVLYLNSLLK